MSDQETSTPEAPGTAVSGGREVDPDAAQPPECVSCRLDAELEMGGVWLCLNCYHMAGSTCSGIAGRSQGADGQVC